MSPFVSDPTLAVVLTTSLATLMALLVVFGNFKAIANAFDKGSQDLSERCFAAVFGHTAWKSCLAMTLLGTGVWVEDWITGADLTGNSSIVGGFAVGGAGLGAFLGITTAFVASFSARRGLEATQFAASATFLVQILALLAWVNV